jgi:hypothetical protein
MKSSVATEFEGAAGNVGEPRFDLSLGSAVTGEGVAFMGDCSLLLLGAAPPAFASAISILRLMKSRRASATCVCRSDQFSVIDITMTKAAFREAKENETLGSRWHAIKQTERDRSDLEKRRRQSGVVVDISASLGSCCFSRCVFTFS